MLLILLSSVSKSRRKSESFIASYSGKCVRKTSSIATGSLSNSASSSLSSSAAGERVLNPLTESAIGGGGGDGGGVRLLLPPRVVASCISGSLSAMVEPSDEMAGSLPVFSKYTFAKNACRFCKLDTSAALVVAVSLIPEAATLAWQSGSGELHSEVPSHHTKLDPRSVYPGSHW